MMYVSVPLFVQGDVFNGAVMCVCVCVCGLVRTYIRGQFCVFNHLTGDVRQVGTSPDHITMPINF